MPAKKKTTSATKAKKPPTQTTMTPEEVEDSILAGKPLPRNLVVDGELYLHQYILCVPLPEKLTINGNFRLHLCRGLKKLPDQLIVKGDLWITDNDDLVKVPGKRLTVGGDLNLLDCRQLSRYIKRHGGISGVQGRIRLS